MSKYILSVCSRSNAPAKSLSALQSYSVYGTIHTRISYDANSWYEGHLENAQIVADDDDVLIMSHDDVEIISRHDQLYKYLDLCKNDSTGFVGVAGATHFDNQGMKACWWNARNFGAARGFVFQGANPDAATPNYFGPNGQVVVLDGCFLACSVKTLKKIGLEKPQYLSSGWDFYDIHMTLKAHQLGLNNYTVPIIIRHESPGEMRKEWYEAREQFCRQHYSNMPVSIPFQKTTGLPI